MKLFGGRWWFGFNLFGWDIVLFNLLPRQLWGWGYNEHWYDGELYEFRLGFFNITWHEELVSREAIQEGKKGRGPSGRSLRP